MHPGPRSFGSQGFTLVELLVGLTLVTLISIILFGGMRFGMRAWESGGERIEDATQIGLVQTLLRRQLGQARMPSDNTGKTAVAFAGQSDRVAFIAPSARPGESGQALMFILGRSDADQRSHLDLSWTPLRTPGETGTAPPGRETARLMENLATIDLAYYGAPDPKQPAQWWDSWDTHGLPALVRLRLTFPQGDRRRWPDLIIRLARSGVVPTARSAASR